MADELRLSIVVPVYNGGELLRESLKGYAEQLTEDMEMLLIDDGSTDSSAEICLNCQRDAEERGRLVRYVRQENQGIAGARNRGIKEAKGKFLCFFDQDDRAELGVYTSMAERMEVSLAQGKVPVGMCGTGFGKGGQWLPYEMIPDRTFEADQTGNLIDSLLLNGFDYPFLNEDIFFYGTVWKCLFVREWVVKEQIIFKAFKSFEDDFLFVLETLRKADTVICCSRTGYYWNQNIHSESHSTKYDKDYIEKCDAFEAYVMGVLGEERDGCAQGVGYERSAGHKRDGSNEWDINHKRDASLKRDNSHKHVLYRSALCYTDLMECLDNLRNSGYDKKEWDKVKHKVLQCKKDGLFDEGKHLKKNIIRKRITCLAVSRLPFGVAVWADALLCGAISVMKRMKGIQALERRRKHGGK